MLLEIFGICEAFCAEAIYDFALEWSVVDVDMSFPCLFIIKAFREIPTRDLVAFEIALVIVERVVLLKLV